ncbi:MAG: GntR family transcriptional regulator [Streptosporangiales bacterium]
MSIDWTDPRSPSRQIADALGDAIRQGEFQPGSRLPSERQLVERYGTAPQTARQAISLLKSEGLVVGMPGRGIFVRERRSPVHVGSDRYTRWFQGQTETELPWEEEIVQLAEVPAPQRIAEVFEIDPGTPVFLRRRRIWLEGTPTQLDDSYYRLEVVRGTPLVEGTTGPGGSYAVLEEYGYQLTRIREDIKLRMPSPEEVRSLRLDKGVPVAELHRVALTDNGPLEVFNAVLDGDRHIFSYAFPAPA